MLRPCYKTHANPSKHADKCRVCWVYLNDPRYKNIFSSSSPPEEDRVCKYRGEKISLKTVASAGYNPNKDYFLCTNPEITDSIVTSCKSCQSKSSKKAHLCGSSCQGYEALQEEETELDPIAKPINQPSKTFKIESATLLPNNTGTAFNSSIIRYKGKLLLAHRTGWVGSQIFIAELNDDYSYTGISHKLNLDTSNSNYGREDPRLFTFRGRLHVAFTGVKGLRKSKGIVTRQLYASLKDDFTVDKIYFPEYCQNDSMLWQKNWQFFEWSNELYCIYSIEPHIVLKVQGSRCSLASYSDGKFEWHGGHKRGGCPPVFIDGLFYHWFHGAVDLGSEWPTRQYNYGVYTFDPKDKFNIIHSNSKPIYYADHNTRPKDQYCSVVFNAGCIFEDDKWIISSGIHDRWTEIHEWDHEVIKKYLLGMNHA